MNDYVARQPLFDRSQHVFAYYLLLGADTRSALLNDPSQDENDGPESRNGLTDLSERKMVFLDFSLELLTEKKAILSDGEMAKTVIVFGPGTAPTRDQCRTLRSYSYKTCLLGSQILCNSVLADYADFILVEFPALSASVQLSLIKQYKSHVTFIAGRIETWDDFTKAKDMGYDLFQGYFFLRPSSHGQHKEIRSLDTSLTSVLKELKTDYPSFQSISSLIEHDLGLSYRLLRLVNSAYLAPKHRINTILQALTYLGMRELNQWVSMLILNEMKSRENSELIKMSLIRAKLMTLMAESLRLPYSGSEPFFAGLFSMIDVILGKDIKDLLNDLPLAEEVKDALSGKNNELRRLLTFVTAYEQGRRQKLQGVYPLNLIKPFSMVSFYFEALSWANFDE